MRVTQSIVSRNLMHNISQSREKMEQLQQMAASGKEVTSSSSDPVQFARASRYREMLAQNDQYIRNIGNARGMTDNYSMLLDDIHSQVLNAKSMAIQGTDIAASATDRQVLSEYVEKIIEEVVALSNSSYLGKAVFAGTATKEQTPFEYVGNQVHYHGNSGSISRRIAEGVEVDINIDGKTLEDTALFDSLINLRDALQTNDKTTLVNLIDTINTTAENVLSLSSQVALDNNHLDMAENRINTAQTNILSFLSQTEDADLAEVIMGYNSQEMAYRAALETTSRAISLNIMDFIR